MGRSFVRQTVNSWSWHKRVQQSVDARIDRSDLIDKVASESYYGLTKNEIKFLQSVRNVRKLARPADARLHEILKKHTEATRIMFKK